MSLIKADEDKTVRNINNTDYSNICRICLIKFDTFQSIFDKRYDEHIKEIASINVRAF